MKEIVPKKVPPSVALLYELHRRQLAAAAATAQKILGDTRTGVNMAPGSSPHPWDPITADQQQERLSISHEPWQPK